VPEAKGIVTAIIALDKCRLVEFLGWPG
jgi:hypothetical protein